MSQNCSLYGPIVHSRVIYDVDHGMMILTEANSHLVYQRALAATCTVWQSFHPRHLWSDWAKENENLVYLSLWDFKRYFTCCKILRHGTSGFTSHLKEGVLLIFITLKNPLPWPGLNLQPLGSSGKHTNLYTTTSDIG
jgi:hypothetical protein